MSGDGERYCAGGAGAVGQSEVDLESGIGCVVRTVMGAFLVLSMDH
jgi:hypothetical protein